MKLWLMAACIAFHCLFSNAETPKLSGRLAVAEYSYDLARGADIELTDIAMRSISYDGETHDLLYRFIIRNLSTEQAYHISHAVEIKDEKGFVLATYSYRPPRAYELLKQEHIAVLWIDPEESFRFQDQIPDVPLDIIRDAHAVRIIVGTYPVDEARKNVRSERQRVHNIVASFPHRATHQQIFEQLGSPIRIKQADPSDPFASPDDIDSLDRTELVFILFYEWGSVTLDRERRLVRHRVEPIPEASEYMFVPKPAE